MNNNERREEEVVLLEEWVWEGGRWVKPNLEVKQQEREEEKLREEREEEEHSRAMREEFRAESREFYIAVERCGSK